MFPDIWTSKTVYLSKVHLTHIHFDILLIIKEGEGGGVGVAHTLSLILSSIAVGSYGYFVRVDGRRN